MDEARRQLDLARQNATLSDTQLRQQVMDLTLQTELAYWELFFAEQNLQVQLQGLELARDQVASNQRLTGQGLAAPIDVLEAETQVATFNQRVFSAQAALTRAENALKMLDRARSTLAALGKRPASGDDRRPPTLVMASLEDALNAAQSEPARADAGGDRRGHPGGRDEVLQRSAEAADRSRRDAI